MSNHADTSSESQHFTHELLSEAFSPWIMGTYENARFIGDVAVELARRNNVPYPTLFAKEMVMANVVSALISVEPVNKETRTKEICQQLQLPGFDISQKKYELRIEELGEESV